MGVCEGLHDFGCGTVSMQFAISQGPGGSPTTWKGMRIVSGKFADGCLIACMSLG